MGGRGRWLRFFVLKRHSFPDAVEGMFGVALGGSYIQTAWDWKKYYYCIITVSTTIFGSISPQPMRGHDLLLLRYSCGILTTPQQYRSNIAAVGVRI